MSLNLSQFKSLIVTPALTFVGLGSQTAINLVTGTAFQESGLVYLKQLGTGPALGLFQMEPATHDYLWTLPSMQPNGSLAARVLQEIGAPAVPLVSRLVWDLYYAAIMCRIKYLSSPIALPANTAIGLANYWKTIYNSSLGAGKVDTAAIANFQAAINA